MREGDATRMQTDAAVRIGAFGTILQVALDRATHVCQLATDLMMATRTEVDLQQVIAVRGGQQTIMKLGTTCARPVGLADVAFVLSLVAPKPVDEHALRLRRSLAHDGPVRLTDAAVAKERIHTRQSLAGLGKDDGARDRSIEAMHNADEHVARLSVFLSDPLPQLIRQRGIARLIALHDLVARLADGDQVIVFVNDLHIRFVR